MYGSFPVTIPSLPSTYTILLSVHCAFVLLSESDLHVTLSRLYQQQQQEKNNLSSATIGRALSPLARCQAINDVIKNRRMTIAGGFDSL